MSGLPGLGVARRRTQLAMSAAERFQLKERIRSATDRRDLERLRVGFGATSGQHSLEQLARLAGRARSPIQVGRDHVTAGGLELCASSSANWLSWSLAC